MLNMNAMENYLLSHSLILASLINKYLFSFCFNKDMRTKDKSEQIMSFLKFKVGILQKRRE